MEYDMSSVLDRVRGLRTVEGLSEEEVARRLGISVEEYQDLEQGTADFSVTFLSNLARVYGIDFMELMTGEKPKLSYYSIVRNGKGLPHNRLSGYTYQHLAPAFKSKEMEPFFVTSAYEPGNETAAMEMTTHDGHEMDYVLTGKLRVKILHNEEDGTVENEFVLGPGDTIYYDSSNPHGMIAVDGEDCTFLAILHVKE